MAAARRLIPRVDGANRDAIRVLDHLDEQIVVLIASAQDACYAGGIPGSAVGSNLAVGIDHFQGLPSLQGSLPMKILRGENGALFSLGPRGHASHQENHRRTNRTR